MPSRLSLRAPGRATSARTLRMTIGPTAISVEARRRRHRRAVGGDDADVEIEPGGVDADLRCVLGAQHHGRGAGVEQERDARAVDLRGNDELAAEAPVDDDLAALADLRLAGEEFGHDAVGDRRRLRSDRRRRR